jgi:hypothetical protein
LGIFGSGRNLREKPQFQRSKIGAIKKARAFKKARAWAYKSDNKESESARNVLFAVSQKKSALET